jgi:tartrate/fumarate subfamily iron-sulfur-dependent hydro-lyase beta chain
MGADVNMEYHLELPLKKEEIKNLHVEDIVYLTGEIFTARDEAHHKMLKLDKNSLAFNPSSMALFHCGPLVKKDKSGWHAISAGPTTSSRMEIFEDKFIEKYQIPIIIGKGGMGDRTLKALQKNISVYTSYTGGAGALAADRIKKVHAVYWLEELGMPEAVWIFKVNEFGPLVVSMDSHRNSLYKKN